MNLVELREACRAAAERLKALPAWEQAVIAAVAASWRPE